MASPAAPAAGGEPHASATAKEPLQEIGRVHATTQFCQAFEKHFDATVVPLQGNDFELGVIGFTLDSIEPHYKSMRAENLLYDDRLNLMAYARKIFDAAPAAQREIDALLKSAALSSDPNEAKSTRALAGDLQKALDRQRGIGYDMQVVIQALIDSYDDVKRARELASSLQGGYGFHEPSPPPKLRDLPISLHYQRQLDHIRDVEGEAARLADAIATKC